MDYAIVKTGGKQYRVQEGQELLVERLAVEAGRIDAVHPLSDGPWIFSRAALSGPAALDLVNQARRNPNHPAGSPPGQKPLPFSTT